jgi:hypothetical protein
MPQIVYIILLLTAILFPASSVIAQGLTSLTFSGRFKNRSLGKPNHQNSEVQRSHRRFRHHTSYPEKC